VARWRPRYTVKRTRVRDRFGRPLAIGENKYDKGHTEADAHELAARYRQVYGAEWEVTVIPTTEVWQVIYRYSEPRPKGLPEHASTVTHFTGAPPRIGFRFRDAFGTATITAAKYLRDL
jgi:hypothetical protein